MNAPAAAPARSWAAEVRPNDRSRSYVYLGRHETRGEAAGLFARWELSQAEELALEFGASA